MRILLFTLNSRFSHSNLALRYIRAFWSEHSPQYPGVSVEMAEYSINSDLDQVLSHLQGRYDILFASTYIWNIESYRTLFQNLRQVDTVRIVLGGPEVTYIDQIPPFADAVIRGEGEEAFVHFVDRAVGEGMEAALGELVDLFKRRVIHKLKDIDVVPFPYGADASTDNKTVYYEASRGCPYRCSYCLSSIDSGVRYLPLDRVLREIDFFLEGGYRTVKFVDRTVNARADRFRAMLRHIIERDRGATSFHFEINAELLREEDFALMATARPGLFKLEAGIQSTHETTIRSIDRRIDTPRVIRNCKELLARTQVDLHVDLIAGLPFETFDRFLLSFDEVHEIRAQQFQLGFLKVLGGTPISHRKDEFEMAVRVNTPYEILRTKWMSYDDLRRLHRVEKAMDRVNFGTMPHALDFLIEAYAKRPSILYLEIGEVFDRSGAFEGGFSVDQAFRLMVDWVNGLPPEVEATATELLRLDYCLLGQGARPAWMPDGVADSLKLRKRLLALPALHLLLAGRTSDEQASIVRSQVGAWRVELFSADLAALSERSAARDLKVCDFVTEVELPSAVPAGQALYLIYPPDRLVIRLLPA